MSTPLSDSEYQKLLLKTVFSFMICDGQMLPKEMEFIKKLSVEKNLFGDLNIEQELELLIEHVNRRGLDFFDDYFKKVSHAELSEEQELELLECAILTVKADEKIKMEEVNFLKILRTNLKSADRKIVEKFPEYAIDFVDKDKFTDIYLKELYENYFKRAALPQFNIDDVKDISDSIKY